MADVEGTIEEFEATVASQRVPRAGAHTSFDIERTLPAGAVQWRVRIARSPSISSPADAFLLDCVKKAVCAVVAQQSIALNGALLVADKPNQGSWRIAVRSRVATTEAGTYKIGEAILRRSAAQPPSVVERYASGGKRISV